MKTMEYRDIRLHFVGIGGAGMSGIAEVLLSLGYTVSGSDIKESEKTIYLKSCGVKIYIGHREENIQGASYLVYTSAITIDNIELEAAKKYHIPVIKRTQILADLMRTKKGISVAGTHGKTTTTGILATIIDGNNFDPTYIIGGRPLNFQRHAKAGRGDYLIIESDESDGSFLLLDPIYSVVTNIDYDHMNFYQSKENLYRSFEQYINRVPFYGIVAINIHDKNIKAIIPRIKRRWVSFGILNDLTEVPTIYATNIVHSDKNTKFDVYIDGKKLGTIVINILGYHNILNALGAITISYFMGIDFQSIQNAISLFKGIERRFQKVFEQGDFELFDDYGHHPTEIRSTLKTLKMMRPLKKRIAIFEPHRFSRTKEHWNEFSSCFKYVDEVYVLDIYSATEEPILNIDSKRLVAKMKNNKNRVFYCENKYFGKTLESLRKQKVTVMALGAGFIGEEIRNWMKNVK